LGRESATEGRTLLAASKKRFREGKKIQARPGERGKGEQSGRTGTAGGELEKGGSENLLPRRKK